MIWKQEYSNLIQDTHRWLLMKPRLCHRGERERRRCHSVEFRARSSGCEEADGPHAAPTLRRAAPLNWHQLHYLYSTEEQNGDACPRTEPSRLGNHSPTQLAMRKCEKTILQESESIPGQLAWERIDLTLPVCPTKRNNACLVSN